MLNQTVPRRNRAHAAAVAAPGNVGVSDHPVLRNTYRLLSMTLVFSAMVALASAVLRLPAPGLLLTLGGYFGLLFLTAKLRNSAWGLVSVFALTGFMGYTIGPLLNAYLALSNGPALVTTAMGVTGLAFLGLSAYARSERAVNMLNLGTFLFVGVLTAFGLGLAAYFFELPALSLAVSGIFVLLMCGLIMYETQNIIAGGETNYIMATVTLFVALYNMFTSLLHLFGFFGDEGA
ncbi:MAG: Bax inhibitor-1/YccA family protein [Gammaproteobacteria bacterium]